MLNPYYDKSADVYLNLGGTAVIFALSVLITLGAFLFLSSIKLKIYKTIPYHFQN